MVRPGMVPQSSVCVYFLGLDGHNLVASAPVPRDVLRAHQATHPLPSCASAATERQLGYHRC